MPSGTILHSCVPELIFQCHSEKDHRGGWHTTLCCHPPSISTAIQRKVREGDLCVWLRLVRDAISIVPVTVKNVGKDGTLPDWKHGTGV